MKSGDVEEMESGVVEEMELGVVVSWCHVFLPLLPGCAWMPSHFCLAIQSLRGHPREGKYQHHREAEKIIATASIDSITIMFCQAPTGVLRKDLLHFLSST